MLEKNDWVAKFFIVEKERDAANDDDEDNNGGDVSDDTDENDTDHAERRLRPAGKDATAAAQRRMRLFTMGIPFRVRSQRLLISKKRWRFRNKWQQCQQTSKQVNKYKQANKQSTT